MPKKQRQLSKPTHLPATPVTTETKGAEVKPKEIFTGELDEIKNVEMPKVEVGDAFIEKSTGNAT